MKATTFSKYGIQFVIGKNGRVLREAKEPTATYEIHGDEGYEVRVSAARALKMAVATEQA